MKFKHTIIIISVMTTFLSCGFYSLNGASIPEGTTSYQVNFFQNNAPLIDPGIDRLFTNALTDLIRDQTRLDLVKSNGDLIYEGEITDYRIAPTTATANNNAAQNRLTITVNLRFFNKNDLDAEKEQSFSFFFDYAGAAQLSGSIRDAALQEIFDRITQDIFNTTLNNW